MIINRKGFTLIEVAITVSMIAIVVIALGRLLLVTYKASDEGYARFQVKQEVGHAFDVINAHFRHINSIDSISDSSLAYSMTDSVNGNRSFRLYLHNALDAEPNPPYSQELYDLRLTDTLNYGDGQVLVRNVVQPISAVFARTGDMIVVDLTVAALNEQMQFKTNISPRHPL